PDLPAIIRGAGMPGGIGHGWVKKRFIDPAPLGGKLIVGRAGVKRIYIKSTVDDNPHVDEGYSKRLDAIEDEAERKAKRYGDWDAYEGAVFDELRDKRFPNEPENAYHLEKPFDIPLHWPRIVSIDWGMRAMTSIGFGAISPKKRVHVYRHLHYTGKKIEYWAPLLKEYVTKEQPEEIVICHSANQDRGTPHTILQQVEEALDYPITLGGRDRIAGKNLVHEYLRWQERPAPILEQDEYDHELAVWIRQRKGEAEYLNYLKLFQKKEPELLPKLLFFEDPDVQIIIDALKACNYNKSNKNGKLKEDVAEFNGDDPYDMLRMLLHAADRYFEQSASEQGRVDEIEEVVEKLKTTGDLTSYYRNMRALEAKEAAQYTPVALSRRTRNYARSHRVHSR